jgi:hypothetical protein
MDFCSEVQTILKACANELQAELQVVRYFGGPRIQGLHLGFSCNESCALSASEEALIFALYTIVQRQFFMHKSAKPCEADEYKSTHIASFLDEIFLVYDDNVVVCDSERTGMFDLVAMDVQAWMMYAPIPETCKSNIIITLGNRWLSAVPVQKMVRMALVVQESNPLRHQWKLVVQVLTAAVQRHSTSPLHILSKEPDLLLLILAAVETSWQWFDHWLPQAQI